ncbi:zinc knuckle CX2CX4HX4C containing protein [Tanacetum coccineum]
MDTTFKKTIKIAELRNDENIGGADVAILLDAVDEVSNHFDNILYGYIIGKRPAFPIVENYVRNTWAKYGLERVMLHNGFFFFPIFNKGGQEQVLENGPWLIRLIPIILNKWMPNARLKKDEITVALVWVKLHNVPIVAYSEIGLSLITRRNTYARALIEVSSKKALVDSLVVAIPFQNGSRYSIETIDIEYEWQPPRCATCKIFDHKDEQCPKQANDANPTQVSDDGFVEVTRKNGRGNHTSKPRHVDGVRLTKPKPNYYYRPRSKKVTTQPINKGKDESDLQEINSVSLQNSFDALMEKDKIFEMNNETRKANNVVGSTMDDSDSEKVENVFVEDNGKPMDDLVIDARKKVEIPPKKTLRKTGIWSGNKNIAFSPETKVHYFERNDNEQMEHENAYSKKG